MRFLLILTADLKHNLSRFKSIILITGFKSSPMTDSMCVQLKCRSHVKCHLTNPFICVNNYLHVRYNLLEKLFQNSAVFFHICIHTLECYRQSESWSDYSQMRKLFLTSSDQILNHIYWLSYWAIHSAKHDYKH